MGRQKPGQQTLKKKALLSPLPGLIEFKEFGPHR